ncbi:probable 2-oxoglutarate/Fe(II)-dependent dioxygenase [Mercurialis annua]|uniref:probable 2-oxoglutarate/Fe(II)-dependent dioxygenase n=1 Tax=Mercurialis annua TaxID=3986 RepID=UPI00215F430A|nr:probable 2-oxoglutarate/Fe(II)-dependent dioxygenase [Mercurialis annua]
MESSRETLKIRKSMIVGSVQELAKECLVKIPPRYERFDDQENPVVDDDESSLLSVPVIDLQRLMDSGDFMDDSELEKLHAACKDWGFFQVVNHGVSNKLVDGVKLETEKLFKLPYEEKKKLWQQPESNNPSEGFGQAFVLSEDQKLDWSDMFAIFTLPLYITNNSFYDKLPPNLREILKAYSTETKRVSMELLGCLAKALKMDSEEMQELFHDGFQAMRMNYYPPCPEPEKAIGFTPHSDADALTILLQLDQTDGLQIRKDGKWALIKPLPNAFVVNVGDILEIVSNGVYKSIEHRVTVNSTKERLSVAVFYSSNLDSILGPASTLISAHNPPIFRQVTTKKYYEEYFGRKLNGKSFLDSMRVADV